MNNRMALSRMNASVSPTERRAAPTDGRRANTVKFLVSGISSLSVIFIGKHYLECRFCL
ncbi:hypothetical protein QQF64_013885, partial [Cirrhinus molitorella]